MSSVIAVAFDFDETLAPDGTSGLLKQRSVPIEPFWDSVKVLYQSGWDPVPAYLYKILEDSSNNHEAGPITKDSLQAWGRSLDFFSGVESLFDRLRATVSTEYPEVAIEYYLISSGIGEILRSTRIAPQFKNIWACDFSYDTSGNIVYPKNIVSFTDKTRYIFHIAKGLVGTASDEQPFAVNKAVNKLRVPFDQIIFVGDGYTDIPCFSLVREKGGIAFGVYDPDNKSTWSRAWEYVADNRVSNLAPADYTESSALWHGLQMATNKIAQTIRLRSKSYQGNT